MRDLVTIREQPTLVDGYGKLCLPLLFHFGTESKRLLLDQSIYVCNYRQRLVRARHRGGGTPRGRADLRALSTQAFYQRLSRRPAGLQWIVRARVPELFALKRSVLAN